MQQSPPHWFNVNINERVEGDWITDLLELLKRRKLMPKCHLHTRRNSELDQSAAARSASGHGEQFDRAV